MYRIAEVDVDEGRPLRCFSPGDLAIHQDDLCIVQAERVQDFGRIGRLQEFEGEPGTNVPSSRVLRRATLQDQSTADENALRSKMAAKTCASMVRTEDLPIRLLRVRYSFDRNVLMILFSADDRVDVRNLAKTVGEELKTRVDLKQIGVRDAAGMIGGLGPCGRELCCCSWLSSFESITVRMAKAQGLSLNPGAIGGNCGRLKCCLSYEYAHYRQLGKTVPRQGTRVHCPGGDGCVIDRQLLCQKVKVRLADQRVMEYGVDEVNEAGNRRDQRGGDE